MPNHARRDAAVVGIVENPAVLDDDFVVVPPARHPPGLVHPAGRADPGLSPPGGIGRPVSGGGSGPGTRPGRPCSRLNADGLLVGLLAVAGFAVVAHRRRRRSGCCRPSAPRTATPARHDRQRRGGGCHAVVGTLGLRDWMLAPAALDRPPTTASTGSPCLDASRQPCSHVPDGGRCGVVAGACRSPDLRRGRPVGTPAPPAAGASIGDRGDRLHRGRHRRSRLRHRHGPRRRQPRTRAPLDPPPRLGDAADRPRGHRRTGRLRVAAARRQPAGAAGSRPLPRPLGHGAGGHQPQPRPGHGHRARGDGGRGGLDGGQPLGPAGPLPPRGRGAVRPGAIAGGDRRPGRCRRPVRGHPRRRGCARPRCRRRPRHRVDRRSRPPPDRHPGLAGEREHQPGHRPPLRGHSGGGPTVGRRPGSRARRHRCHHRIGAQRADHRQCGGSDPQARAGAGVPDRSAGVLLRAGRVDDACRNGAQRPRLRPVGMARRCGPALDRRPARARRAGSLPQPGSPPRSETSRAAWAR